MKKLFLSLFLAAMLAIPSVVYAGPPMPIFHWGAQSYSDIVSLFGSGSCSGYLKSDGTCDNSSYTRDVSTLNLTSDTSITAAQVLANKYITNQGSSGEVDLTLPAVSYTIAATFICEETNNIEVNPPSGEAFDLNGTTMTADYVVDSDSTVGSSIVALRHQIADASWIWSLYTVRGAWVDHGGVSD